MHPKMPTFQPPMFVRQPKAFFKDKKTNPALAANKKNGKNIWFWAIFPNFFLFVKSHFRHNKRDQNEVERGSWSVGRSIT